MRFSYALLPDYPIHDSIATIQLADRLDFYGVYGADETWHKDMYCLFAAAADKTHRIRFGPSLAPIQLREPTLVAQAIATLDELTNGRVDCVISNGNFSLLAQYGIDWSKQKPLSRTREAHTVIRTLLDEGHLDYEGDFFNYAGLFTFARPVQERIPVLIGAMRGPKSYEAAGELSDGTHCFGNYSREACDYMVEHLRIGAERAGKDWGALDIGAWLVVVIGPDSAEARRAAQTIGAFYIPAMHLEQLARHGIGQAEVQPILDSFASGDIQEAIDQMTPELAEKLTIAGTASEVVERIKTDIEPSGVNHLIFAVTDGFLVRAFTGRDVDVPYVDDQLQMIHDDVMPAFD